MKNKYERKIINTLISKYESSKSFLGTNKVKQTFSVEIRKLFPKYADDSEYEVFMRINEALDILARNFFIYGKVNTANVYTCIILNVDKLDEVYSYVGRTPKKDINNAVLNLLETYKDKNEILTKYAAAQQERIRLNKAIQFFNDDLVELENIMIAVDKLLQVETETFVRDFSIRVFKDSKAFEAIASKVENLVFEFGHFPDKEQVLGNLNIVKNPTYVNFKGTGKIILKGQIIDLSALRSDIAISSIMLSDIDEIQVMGKGVITIENLTSFHTFNEKGMFAIYLGGYHNMVRREFIQKVAKQNLDTHFYHFGDIDAGGFYILEHLKKRTGVNFQAYKMDVETLKTYGEYTKRLTPNDKNRLVGLVGGEYDEVVRYMLEHDCKLEQEALGVSLENGGCTKR